MAHFILAGAAAVSGLYAARVGLRVAQRMSEQKIGQNYSKGGSEAFRMHIGGFDEYVSAHEARLILGVNESATKEEIKKTHRALILRNHADRGGSPYLARKINESRDVLMGPK